MINEHGRRNRIFNPAQHPLVHDIGALGYANAAIPGKNLLSDVLDYIIAVLSPKYRTTVADKTALNALAAPAINDYVIVSDDGDGRAAAYVYMNIEGTTTWFKRFDVDWTVEGILGELNNRTQYQYVQKYGMLDKDSTGADVTGNLVGQSIYGGSATLQNLTLYGNVIDTTGYVQFGSSSRPLVNNAYDFGTASLGWKSAYFTGTIHVGNTSLSQGSLSDSGGAFSFGSNNLSTTGTLASGTHTIGTLTLAAASINDSSNAISFNACTLTTTANLQAAIVKGSTSLRAGAFAGNNLILAQGSITDDSGAISFGAMNLLTSGTLGAGAITGTTVSGGNLRLSVNSLISTNVDGNILISPNGAGNIQLTKAATSLGLDATGTITATTAVTSTGGYVQGGNIRLTGDIISTQDANGDLTITPNGSGTLITSCLVKPGTDASYALGLTNKRWTNVFMSGSIGDGTNTITIADLLSLRSSAYRDSGRTQPAQAGDAIFWSGTQWLASVPDTEILHSSISGLTTGDAGHTQFALLAGRAGGQALQGGTAASENLTLESTAHATKGSILVKDNVSAFTNASFSGTWSGTDIGDATHYFRDVYTKGVHKGFRLENYTSGTLPSASASAIGRVVWSTDNDSFYIDTGGSWVQAGGGGGGGGSLTWVEDANSPTPLVANSQRIYAFQSGLAQVLNTTVKVPKGYIAGQPINLRFTWYSPDNSGNVLISTIATLIRTGTDAVTSTTNQRTSTNAAVTLGAGTVNIPQAVTADLTSASGQVNGVAVSAGDLLFVQLTRGTDTGVSDVNVLVHGAEETFS